MRCADVRSDLFRYAEGAVNRWQTVRISVHIARCGNCREEMEALHQSQQKLAAALQEPVQAPDISRLVMPLLSASPAPIVGRFVWKSVAALALAVALILACALTFQQHRYLQQPQMAKKAPQAPVVRHSTGTDTHQKADVSERVDTPVTPTNSEAVPGPEVSRPDHEEQANKPQHRRPYRSAHPKQVTKPKTHPVPEKTNTPREPAVVEDEQPVAIAVVTWPGSRERSDTSYGYEEHDKDTGETTTCSVDRSDGSVSIYLESKPTGKNPIKGENCHEKNHTARAAH